MNRYLIVDDNNKRYENLIKVLSLEFSIPQDHIDRAIYVKQALNYLKTNFYSMAFIDMSLPINEDDIRPESDAGVRILKYLTGNNYKKPGRVIGFTAFEDDVERKKREFEKFGFKFFHAPSHDLSWLASLKEQIIYDNDLFELISRSNYDYALVTVHGIRTFGPWQEKLSRKISEKNSIKQLSHFSFKFTLIDTFSFLIPKKRRFFIDLFKDEFIKWLEENPSRKVVFFAHSFGTYILINALKEIPENLLKNNCELIVLCGSVLNQSFDIRSIQLKTQATIVNECATNDTALLFSEAFVPGTGMAGRLGFVGLSSNKLINRFHKGDHSVYFKDSFIENKWLPLLDAPAKIVEINEAPSSYFISGLAIGLAKFFSRFKARFCK